MHNVLAVEIGKTCTDILEIFLDLILWNLAHFYFVIEGSSFRILEDHVGDLFLSIDVDIKEFDDFRVSKSIVHHNFIFGYFVDLD